LVASAVSPLHDMAAFVEKEETVVVRADGKEPTVLASGKGASITRSMALFSPDGSRLYTTHDVEGKEVIRAWDLRRGRMVGESGDRRRVERAAVARDGSLFAGADYKGVRLFRPKTLAPIGEIPAPTDARGLAGRLGALALSADGDALAAAVAMTNSRGNDVYLWAGASGLQKWRDDDAPTCLPQIGNVEDLVLSTDGKLVITAVQNARSRTSWINVFDAGTGKLLGKLGPLNQGLHLDLSPDDHLLGVATTGEVMLFDLPKLLQK
jgi:WD40 repeat protein